LSALTDRLFAKDVVAA